MERIFPRPAKTDSIDNDNLLLPSMCTVYEVMRLHWQKHQPTNKQTKQKKNKYQWNRELDPQLTLSHVPGLLHSPSLSDHINRNILFFLRFRINNRYIIAGRAHSHRTMRKKNGNNSNNNATNRWLVEALLEKNADNEKWARWVFAHTGAVSVPNKASIN